MLTGHAHHDVYKTLAKTDDKQMKWRLVWRQEKRMVIHERRFGLWSDNEWKWLHQIDPIFWPNKIYFFLCFFSLFVILILSANAAKTTSSTSPLLSLNSVTSLETIILHFHIIVINVEGVAKYRWLGSAMWLCFTMCRQGRT